MRRDCFICRLRNQQRLLILQFKADWRFNCILRLAQVLAFKDHRQVLNDETS